MKYDQINTDLFIGNRINYRKLLESNAVAFFNSNDEMPRNGDANFTFRQQSDIFYLTGIDQEQSILVICPDHPLPQYREMLFLRQTSPTIAVWEGHKYTKEEAQQVSGIKSIYWLDQFESLLPVIMNHSQVMYLNMNENDRFTSEVPYRELRFAIDMKERYPSHRVERSAPLMAVLRSVKSAIEIEVMKIAMDITEKAFRRILGFIRPGVMEYQIEAEIIHEFLMNKATGHAYSPIVASGGNACVLHYVDNNLECKDGDVILMDFGAEYANYAADLTRCVPVNGKFTQRQKEVYNAVLGVMRQAIKMLVPGNTIEKYHSEVGVLMEEALIKLGLLNTADVKKQNPSNPLYKKYFMHGTSHFLGLDVHDIGNKYEPMQEGMVFTCEPGIYIPEENLGIRIENDILVTKNGPIDLMASIPVEAEEIEELMQSNLVQS